MRVGATERCEAEIGGEAPHAAARRGAEDRGVVRLQAVWAAGGIPITRRRTNRPLLGAERVREEGVSGDGDPPLFVDLRDGATERVEWADAFVEEETKEVSLQRRDLFANDHLHMKPIGDRHLLCRLRRINAIVIRDGDDVETDLFRVREHLRN